jgi:hypothetical protein
LAAQAHLQDLPGHQAQRRYRAARESGIVTHQQAETRPNAQNAHPQDLTLLPLPSRSRPDIYYGERQSGESGG